MGILKYFTSREFIVTVIAIVAISILLLFGLMRYLDYYTLHDKKIEVPDLQKLSIAETEKVLNDKSLHFVVIDSASFNPDYPPRSVIEQNPEAGDYVKSGRKIYLTLNPTFYKSVRVPDYKAKDGSRLAPRQIIARLKSTGFQIGEIIYKPYKYEIVLGYRKDGKKLEPGTKLPKYSKIDIVVGDDGSRKRELDTINNPVRKLP